MNTEFIAKLEKIGKVWQKNDFYRIYFNCIDLYGLELEYYKTGNIRTAWLNGKIISNTQARGLANEFQYGKLWYDVNKEKFKYKDIDDNHASIIITTIMNRAT